MATSASAAADDLKAPASGQSPLASQRDKEANPEKRKLKFPSNAFPLGYKEGLSQWVC